MRFLRVLMYFILLTCICWGILIFSGPKIINVATQRLFDDKIKLHRVKVNPNLAIEIARVELHGGSDQSVSSEIGIIKALKISWALSDRGPMLRVETGPVKLVNLMEAQASEIVLSPLEFAVLPQTIFDATFHETDIIKKSTVPSITVTGLLLPGFKQIKDVMVRAEQVRYHDFVSLRAKGLTGSIDLLNFSESFSTQKNEIYVVIDEIETIDKTFKIVSSELKILNDQDKKNAIIKLRQLSTQNGKLNEISSLLSMNNHQLEISSSGIFNDYSINHNGNFLGHLKNLGFNMVSKMKGFDGSSRFVSSTTISFDEIPKFSVNLDGSLDLDSWNSWHTCALVQCELQNFVANYSVVLSEGRFDGQSFCLFESCTFKNLRHKFISTNTDSFFLSLGGKKIFSPLALAAAYGWMTNGRPVANGHEINF